MASTDATEHAEATLIQFFDAWQRMDERGCEALLADYKKGLTWQFKKVDRTTFGTTTPAPGFLESYESDPAKRARMRCFQATYTVFYRRGQQGPAEHGEPYDWFWILERDAQDEWRIRDWGY